MDNENKRHRNDIAEKMYINQMALSYQIMLSQIIRLVENCENISISNHKLIYCQESWKNNSAAT